MDEWTEKEMELIYKCIDDFPLFHKSIFSLGFENGFKWGNHLEEWSKMLQKSDNTCILAPRKHSKSTTIYAYLEWLVLRNPKSDLEILYLSYKQDLAAYHLKNFKNYLSNNMLFRNITDLTPAESLCKYSWDGKHKIIIEPEGITSFKRGRHPHGVILDDVLADPTTMLDLSVIEKINRVVFEDVMSLPKEGGFFKAIGTAQTPVDFFFKLKDDPNFSWGIFPAIKNELKEDVLWYEMFPYKRLMEIKNTIGERAFKKEYMLEPVYSADSFFQREQILSIVNRDLLPKISLQTDNNVYAGWDIGKKAHPSHFVVFEVVDDVYIQRFQKWYDNVDLSVQLEDILGWMDRFQVDKCYFDATRGEYERELEAGGKMDKRFIPITFTNKVKASIATEFEKHVLSRKIELLNNQRQIEQILNVTNDLDSVETEGGHGDSYWSNALVFAEAKRKGSSFMPLTGG